MQFRRETQHRHFVDDGATALSVDVRLTPMRIIGVNYTYVSDLPVGSMRKIIWDRVKTDRAFLIHMFRVSLCSILSWMRVLIKFQR